MKVADCGIKDGPSPPSLRTREASCFSASCIVQMEKAPFQVLSDLGTQIIHLARNFFERNG